MITFRDFMESALYDGKEGFYARRTPKDDFYTAAELHPAFARSLARSMLSKLDAVAQARPRSPLFVLEMGSGDGTLAKQVIADVKELAPHWINRVRWILVERVEKLLMSSILKLQDSGVRLLGYTRLEEAPRFSGVIYSNELVDAMPVHVVEKKDGRIRELYVRPRDAGAEARTELGLLSRRALVHAARALQETLPEGQRHAVNLEARTWMSRVAGLLRAGYIITVDYGKKFPPGAPNAPRTFFRHTTGRDIAADPGRRDLTADVDFAQLIAEGEKLGLRTERYSTLARFLIDHGVLDSLPAGDTLTAYKERAKIKTLFHPDGMGEKFKVLIQEKGISECS